jgi:signal peptidase I
MTMTRIRQRPAAGRRMVAGLLTVAALAAFWWLLAPTAIGGRSSYVITDGTSMLPRFHANGLVITRSQRSYRVGEVVAYHNRDLGRVVLHRIVAIHDGRYVFKGDNNGFRDRYHPRRSELVGAERVYWPGGGRWLQLVRSPATFAVVVGLIAFVAFRPAKRSRRKRRHHAR